MLDKLRALNIEPSELASDSEFIRRAYLDSTGTLPTAAETEEFLPSYCNGQAQDADRPFARE